MVKHRYNQYGALGSLAAASMLAIPFGFGVAALPVLGYLAGTTIAALFVPGSRRFRNAVDYRKHSEIREAARNHLISEITERVGHDHQYWSIYRRMLDRVDALQKVAEQHDSALSLDDVERLNDATVDFLGLWLGRIAIHERHQMFTRQDVERRIAQVDKQLETVSESNDKRRLLKAKSDLVNLVKKREEMKTRDAAADAAMLSMADTFDEVYQRVMANPSSTDNVKQEIGYAVEQMNIEEELDMILEEEVDAMLEEPSNEPHKMRVAT